MKKNAKTKLQHIKIRKISHFLELIIVLYSRIIKLVIFLLNSSWLLTVSVHFISLKIKKHQSVSAVSGLKDDITLMLKI